MSLIGISPRQYTQLVDKSISAPLSCLSSLAVVCASLALPVLGRTRGRNSRGLLVHRRLGDPFGSVYAKSPSIKLSCFTLETCIVLFSTLQREGQLSGKPTRPSTSYRQPARASSGDAPAGGGAKWSSRSIRRSAPHCRADFGDSFGCCCRSKTARFPQIARS
jgi:hypothetical protein